MITLWPLIGGRYLKRTGTAKWAVSSGPVRFQPSGQGDQFGLCERADAPLAESCPSVLSQGSVVVTSDLWFNQPISPKEAESQLKAGLRAAGPTELVIDSDRILITGEIPDSLRKQNQFKLVQLVHLLLHFVFFVVFFSAGILMRAKAKRRDQEGFKRS